MASPYRTTRNVVATTCLLLSLGVPTAALAGPPAHAPAHGHRDRVVEPTRTTTSATADGRDGTGTADRRGKGDGRRPDPPGQRRKADDGPSRGGSVAPDGSEPGPARPTSPSAPDQPTPVVESPQPRPAVEQPRPPVAAPAPATPAGGAAAPTGAGTTDTVDPVPAPTSAPSRDAAVGPDAPQDPGAAGEAPGREVWRPQVGGPFGELLRDLDRGVHRVDQLVPRHLTPTGEPLARLVPLLLGVLGAFLALQRGIGNGLGHVPMVASTAPHDPMRRD